MTDPHDEQNPDATPVAAPASRDDDTVPDPDADTPVVRPARGFNRRSFVVATALGGVAAGGALGAAALVSDEPLSGVEPTPRRVDVHHHAMPPAVRKWMVDHDLVPPVGGPPFTVWEAHRALAVLDDNEIDLAVLSAAVPGVFTPESGQARELSRLANDTLAELVKDRPDRYGLFAHLPLHDVDSALDELARAYDDLDADGVLLMAHTGTTYLGDPTLDPLVAELDSRRAVVLVHPFNLPGATPVGTPPIPAFLADFAADTTRAALQLVRNGVLDRYPDVQWVLAHGGGALPYLGRRLTTLGTELGYGLTDDTLTAALRRFRYDTAGPMSPYATPSLLAAAGADRILFGSDYNAVTPAVVAATTRDFLTDPALDPHTRKLVARDNALALLPRVARRLEPAARP